MDQRRGLSDWPIVRMLPAAWLMATIWWLSDQQRLPTPPGINVWLWSTAGHVLMYGLLAVFVWWALGMNNRLLNRERALYAVVIVFAYGALDEFHQRYVPGRDASQGDMLANLVGAALAMLIVPRLVKRFGW